ncbi:hypothetical protein CEXT_314081 [Caerostris extrusa]|uniref:Uncharacterized protein n=1 Tax=Caerostris extrusa TaxID=172846 RepID=A0AAV4PDM9_CAEEX|nr:hypothetical protein CEXT_314081 [Caerostris extrusa]
MSEELSIKNGIIAMPWAQGLASADGRGLVMEMRLCSKTSRPYKRCHRRTVGVAGEFGLISGYQRMRLLFVAKRQRPPLQIKIDDKNVDSFFHSGGKKFEHLDFKKF